MTHHRLVYVLAIAVAALNAAAGLAAERSTAPADIEFFESKVRPILAEHCYECHGPDKQKSNLRWDHIDFALKGGERGPAIVPGEPDKSRMIEAIGYMDSELRMPPKSKLPDAKIEVLKEWVRRGAPWPNEPVPQAGAGAKVDAFDLAGRREAHWSWRPIQRPTLPSVRDTGWASGPIDVFVLAKLEAAGLKPAPDADRRTLIRRVYLDLIGLPPTPEHVEAFVHDNAADAYERIVDSLLASPQFGERWARHWLDLTRYAETYGHEFDYPINVPWKYRDYVIRALNADVPYDRFASEQIAGDLLPQPRIDPETGIDQSVLATGFWYMHEQTHAPTDVRQHEVERIDNQIDVFSKTFLGLTVSCARCHDHKFDAISTKDYYALAGYMESSRQQDAYLDANGRIAAAIAAMRTIKAEGDKLMSQRAVKPQPQRAQRADIVFEDFERETYAPWTTEGDAFGSGPVASSAVPAYQGELGMHGQRAVNSHASAPDGDSPARDARMGKLISPAFTIERDYIRFLIGGGAHQGLAVRLDVDGQAVRTARGGNTNAMKLAEFHVADLAGRKAQIVIVDAQAGGWGNIGADHFVFTDSPAASPGPVAVDAGPIVLGDEDSKQRGLIGSFDGADFGGWRATGWAWGDAPTQFLQWDAIAGGSTMVRPGMAHSGLLGRKAQGTLRSPTFTITHPQIHIRAAGQGAVRLIIEGFTLAGHSALLFGGTRMDINSPDRLAWHGIGGDTRLYIGHTAYLEFIDDGDGFLVVDQVWQGELGPRRIGDEPRSLNAEATSGDADAFADLKRRFDAADAAIPPAERALAITDGSGEDSYVHIRGSWKSVGEPAPRRMLTALGGEQDPPLAEADGSGRLRLVERMFDASNPYPARVRVNRLWHHLLGRGIVPTVDNFGVLGQEPTHPELLDYLAERFRTDLGWSQKRVIREIVLSRTYRMSSKPTDAAAAQIDGANHLLHRQRVRRLEGETIRDAILAVSGRLDKKMFGPPVPVHLTPFMQGRGRPGQSGPVDGAGRRSVYLEVRRNFLVPMFQAFDTPIPFSTVGQRTISNVPAQALILMNDPFVIEQSRVWADRIVKSVASPSDRIERMYAEAFGRPPTADEVAGALAFFDRQAAGYGVDPQQARDELRIWSDFAHVLFNVKEFIVAY